MDFMEFKTKVINIVKEFVLDKVLIVNGKGTPGQYKGCGCLDAHKFSR